jgi:predicted GH43/DUF377 family glycosyl hydrolase
MDHRQTFPLMLLVAVGSAALFYFGREYWAHIFVRAAGEMPTRSGLGPPPMLTDYGRLILYHGVRATCVER